MLTQIKLTGLEHAIVSYNHSNDVIKIARDKSSHNTTKITPHSKKHIQNNEIYENSHT